MSIMYYFRAQNDFVRRMRIVSVHTVRRRIRIISWGVLVINTIQRLISPIDTNDNFGNGCVEPNFIFSRSEILGGHTIIEDL